MAPLSRLAAVAVTTLLGLTGMLALGSPANAADGFKYWGYYQYTDAGWEAAAKGADSLTPEDGALEGWHFAVTAAKPNRPPRTDATFADICAGTEAGQGEKRVAVAIDYGTAAEANEGDQPPQPVAECAVVPQDATGQQVLESVAQVRVEGGLTCAIDGYPAEGCGDPVSDVQIPKDEQVVDFAMPQEASQQSAAAADSGGVAWPLVGVGALVVLLGGGAVVLARRRRT
jgi:hypothetical protein